MPFEKEKIEYELPKDGKTDIETINAREARRIRRAKKKVWAGKFVKEYLANYFSYRGGELHRICNRAVWNKNTFLEKVSRAKIKENLVKCASHHENGRVTKNMLLRLLKEIEANRLKMYVSGKRKRKIICLLGKSGSGKTLAAMHMKHKFGVNVIIPFTNRPPKEYEIEGLDYHFIDICPPPTDVLTVVKRKGYLKYALVSQAHEDVSIYMPDTKSFEILASDYADDYEVFSVLIKRNINKRRLVQMDDEQEFGDDGLNYRPLTYYNYVIDNNGTKRELFDNIERIFNEVSYGKGKERPGDGHSV